MSLLRQANNRFLFILTVVMIFIVVGWQLIQPTIVSNPQHVAQATSIALTQEMKPTVILPTSAVIIPTLELTETPLPLDPTRPRIENRESNWDLSEPSIVPQTHLVYVADDNTLWIVSLDDLDNPQQLTDFAVSPHSLAVTEQYIYFRDGFYDLQRANGHWLYDLETGDLSQLPICNSASDCGSGAISPDGKWVATYVEPNELANYAQFLLYNIDRRNVTRNINVRMSYGDALERGDSLMWSPDSSQIIFTYDLSLGDEEYALYHIQADTFYDTNFLEVPIDVGNIVLSEDGQYYSFASEAQTPTSHGIQVWSTQDHELVFEVTDTLTDTHRMDRYRPLDWHPNGEDILVAETWRIGGQPELEYRLMLYNMVSGEARTLLPLSDLAVGSAQFNADGTLLLFENNDGFSLYDMATETVTALPLQGDRPLWVAR